MPSHDPSRVSRIFAALGDANRALDIEEAAYPVTRYQLALPMFRGYDIIRRVLRFAISRRWRYSGG